MKRPALSLALLVFVMPASACRFEQRSATELMATSRTVFRAQITQVKPTVLPASTGQDPSQEIVEARYKVLEVLKGESPSSGVVRDLPSDSKCSLGLTVGSEYVLIPDEHEMVPLSTGSFSLPKSGDSVATQRLEAFRKLAATGAK